MESMVEPGLFYSVGASLLHQRGGLVQVRDPAADHCLLVGIDQADLDPLSVRRRLHGIQDFHHFFRSKPQNGIKAGLLRDRVHEL